MQKEIAKLDSMKAILRERASATRKANHPGLDVRAVQYALAMLGIEYKHSAEGYTEGRVTVASIERGKPKRAKRVTLRAHGVFDIPNWDWVEPCPVDRDGNAVRTRSSQNCRRLVGEVIAAQHINAMGAMPFTFVPDRELSI